MFSLVTCRIAKGEIEISYKRRRLYIPVLSLPILGRVIGPELIPVSSRQSSRQ